MRNISSSGLTMSISNQELIQYSEGLLASGPDEVALRSAVSRSYYAAYHQALDLANKLKCPQPAKDKHGCHEKLIDRYKSMSTETLNISGLLQKQKIMRVVADYKLSKEFSRKESELHVKSCSKLIKVLQMMSLVS